MIRGDKKVLVDTAGESWLYDLTSDSNEKTPRPAAADAAGREMLEALDRLRADPAARAGPGPDEVELDEATRKRLRALGYGVAP